jgi:hypothetical protein
MKSIIINRYNSPFNPCLWVRNKYCDFIVLGIRADVIYKIITATDNKEEIKKYWQEKQSFINLKKELRFIYPNAEWNEIKKEEIVYI